MAADPRQFTEHNTLGNVSVYLEDKRMEELKSATAKTSSQISTSAQYIPLQDTDGNLVKINPASFEEAVRNVLGSLLANNDKGTTISGLPALSGSGANLDFGSVTPANLASVLGGIEIERDYFEHVYDFDLAVDYPGSWAHIASDSHPLVHCPTGCESKGGLVYYSGEERYRRLQLFREEESGIIYQRYYRQSSGWQSWTQLSQHNYLESYASLSSLATALGVFVQGRGPLASCDLNDMIGLSKCGVWLLHPNYTYTNNNGISNGCLMVFSIDGGGRHFHVVFDGSLSHIYGRLQWVGNWGEWKQIM